jgi:hypothetical protein
MEFVRFVASERIVHKESNAVRDCRADSEPCGNSLRANTGGRITMAKEKKPACPLPEDFVPALSVPYRVHDDDNWWKVAARFNLNVWDLIWVNFRTKCPEEVNWYLRERVGCQNTTADGKNYVFHGADPAKSIIYIPLYAVRPLW